MGRVLIMEIKYINRLILLSWIPYDELNGLRVGLQANILDGPPPQRGDLLPLLGK